MNRVRDPRQTASPLRRLRRGMPPIAGILLLASWAASAPLDPLSGLEKSVRAGLARDLKACDQSSAGRRGGILPRLEESYGVLHDLRNHAAFASLWRDLGWRRDNLRVLYIASGAHLAPLAILWASPAPRTVDYVFTEIDPAVPGRVRGLLHRMTGKGLWNLREDREGGDSIFRFRAGSARATLRIALGRRKAGADVPPAFTAREVEEADLVITHDWSGDPHDNLAMLYDIVQSACASGRTKPLAVVMEDLDAHPFPIDLSLFHPAARTRLPYGHLDHAHLPDGTRLEAEDGPPLFGGGVALTPDWKALCGLDDDQRETLFDTLLFSGFLFGRLNVDLVGGRRVQAPALLDLGAGFGYRDIRGIRRQGEKGYLPALASRAAALLPAVRAFGGGPSWCRLLKDFRESLSRAAAVDPRAWMAAAGGCGNRRSALPDRPRPAENAGGDPGASGTLPGPEGGGETGGGRCPPGPSGGPGCGSGLQGERRDGGLICFPRFVIHWH